MNEHQQIEWKQSWRDEYLKWICGFANAHGGVLEIGKDNKGRVVGIEDAAELLENLPNRIRDLLGVVVDVDLLDEGGKDFIRITVEPYPYPISYRGEYHYRTGSTKQVLKGAALDRFLLGRTGKRWDAVPVPGVKVDDLDSATLSTFRTRAARSKRLGPDVLEENDAGLIEKLRLIEGKYLKRAAVLLFHPDPERFVTGAFVKIGYFESNSDLLYHDEVHGDLFKQVDGTLDLLLTKYLKALISYEGVQRVERFPIPEVALREILLNAVAHKDYSSSVPIQISVYSDRVLIWNNGQLPDEWTVERLMGKHPSQPFNPDIANAFFRAGMIEAWGRGVEKVIQACRDHGGTPPEWRSERTGLWVEFPISSNLTTETTPPDTTTTKAPKTILEAPETTPKAPETTPKTTPKAPETTPKTTPKAPETTPKAPETTPKAPETAQNTTQKVLAALRENHRASSRDIAQMIGELSEDGVKYQLDKLKGEGLIRHVGPSRGGYWEIEGTTSKTTPKTALKILAVLQENPQASSRDIAQMIGELSQDGVKHQLDKLKAEGLIRRVGPSRGGHWEIIEEEE